MARRRHPASVVAAFALLMTLLGPASAQGRGDVIVDLEAMRISAEGKMMWNEGEEALGIAAGKDLERNPCAVVVGGR